MDTQNSGILDLILEHIRVSSAVYAHIHTYIHTCVGVYYKLELTSVCSANIINFIARGIPVPVFSHWHLDEYGHKTEIGIL